MTPQKEKPKRFLVPAETLSEIRKVIMTLREATLSQSEHKALGKLLGSLTHLDPEPVAAKSVWPGPQAFTDSLLKEYKKNFEEQYLRNWVTELSFAKSAQTSTSSLVGKRVYRVDTYKKTDPNKQIGVVKQELITGELIVDFCNSAHPGMWSNPLPRSVLEIIE